MKLKLASTIRRRYALIMIVRFSSARPGRRGAVGVALMLGGIAALTLAAVWGLQWSGYVPCELCLVQREPFYVALPLALLTAAAARAGRLGWTRAGMLLLAVVFLVSAALGVFHAGVEWGWWAGPAGCTGPMPSPAAVGDFLKQLETVKVVRCDAPSLRVVGLSLAGWNAILSLILGVTAGLTARALGPDTAR